MKQWACHGVRVGRRRRVRRGFERAAPLLDELQRIHSVDAFGYLSVLISIVLGLGITQLLAGFSRGATAAFTRSERAQHALAYAALTLFLVYTAVLFADLA